MQDWVFRLGLTYLLTYLLGPILVADIHIHQKSMTNTNGNVNEGKKNTYILFTRLFKNIRCVVKVYLS